MKRAWLLVTVAVVLAATWPVPGVLAQEARTLTGEYVWSGGGTGGDLEAVFTPAAEGTWDVEFRFEHRGKPHIYTGTAEGSVSEGPLRGTVLNENKKRTFTFEGEFKDGTFRGTHSEIEEGKEKSTGTMTLLG